MRLRIERPEGTCSKCRRRPKLSYFTWCRECKNEHARLHRRPLQGEARRRDSTRSYANTYQKRGHLVPQPCERCGSREVEKHHPSYDHPLYVRWFCKAHHKAEHNELKLKPWKVETDRLRAEVYYREAGLPPPPQAR